MIRVVIADDHQLFVEGLKLIFSSHKNLRVAGEACNGKQLLALLPKIKADIVLLDVLMPEMNGIEAAKQIVRCHTHLKIIALTMCTERQYVIAMLHAGIAGYVLKTNGSDAVLDAIDEVSCGKSHYDFQVMHHIMEGMKPLHCRSSELKEELTKGEAEVLKLIVANYTSNKIAVKMNLSPETIKTYCKIIYRKLGLRGKAALVKYGLENGYAE